MKKLFARPRAKEIILSQAGQGIVEYMLILVVVVGIGLGILYQFNSAFGQYMDGFFGDYLACLIEAGELPGLGGNGITAEECQAALAEFDINNGAEGPGTSSGSGGNGDGGNNGNSSGTSSGSSGGGRSGSVGSFSRGGGSGNSDFNSNRLSPAKQVSRGRVGRGGGKSSAGESGEESSGSGRRRRRRIVKRVIGGQFIRLRGAKNRPKKRRIASRKKAVGYADLKKPLIKKPKILESKKKPPEIEKFEFSMSNIIKWAVIIIIVIFILIFVGGQVQQIRKSWEKAE